MPSRREFLFGAAAPLARPARRPNIVVILADDLGWADVGFQGARDIPTPNLNRLAAGGVRFTSACISHPFCSPTRAGLMTGRYQQRFGHENNPVYNPQDETSGLPTSETTMAQVLGGAGYATGVIGKWHLGAAPRFHPMKRGFQEMFAFLGGGHDYTKAGVEGEPREYFIPIQRDGKPVEERAHLTDAFSREAAAFIRRHRTHPFFLYLAYNAPHTPLQPTDAWLERVRHIQDETRRRYAAMVCGLDDGVGTVMAALKEQKLDNNTLVIFLSDNGGVSTVSHSSNAPLRGQKGQVFEGGIRTPWIMRWSGRLRAGSAYTQPVISLDILPTAAALAGARLPAGIDGVDLMPYVLGARREAPHRRLFWRTGGGTAFAVREGRYKLARQGGEPMLFDLQTDPNETTDIAAAQPAVRDRLLAAYGEWNRELIPPVFSGLGQRPGKKKQ